MTDSPIRINKYLADQKIASRREADALIADKKVLVNGKVAIKGTGQELLKNQDIQAAYLEGGIKK